METDFDRLNSFIPRHVSREAALDSLAAGEPDGAITALIEDAFSAGVLSKEALEIVDSVPLDTPYAMIVDEIRKRVLQDSAA